MAKIIIADDHGMVRDGLKMLIQTEPGYEVVAETDNGAAIEALVEEFVPDLLLLDLGLPGCHGIEVATRITSRFASVKILVLTGNLDAETVNRALAAGVAGYVIKQEHAAELMTAINAVLAGRQYVSKGIAAVFQQTVSPNTAAAATAAQPTPREQEIIRLIAGGATNHEIAANFNLSVLTIRTHRQNLMEKLNLRNAAEITAYAVKQGFYSPV